MSRSQVLETYIEEYRSEWLELYKRADEMKEYGGNSEIDKAVQQSAKGIHILINSLNSDSEPTSLGTSMSYMLDTVILATQKIAANGSQEDVKALKEIISMSAKTASYVLKNRGEQKGFWNAVDEDKTIDNITTVLEADKRLN